MSRKWMTGLALLAVALAVAACGAAATVTPAPTATAARVTSTQAPTATTVPAQAAATKPAAAAAATATPAPAAKTPAAAAQDSLTLSSRAAGLDKLQSYRMRWQANWSTTSAGKTDKSSWDWTEEYTAKPQALHWIWKTPDASGKNTGQVEMFQVGSTSYMVSYDDTGKASCTSFSSDDPSSQLTKGMFSPDALGAVSGAKLAGSETVNGIPAKHYKYDQSSGLMGYGKVAGDVWVANDGGYVVKDVMSWEGSNGLFGSNSKDSGQGNWTWELTNANQPIAITPPTDCGGATASLPIMADATNKMTIGGMMTYNTPSKAADVLAFYQKEMQKAGWTQDGEPTSAEGFSSVSFKKGDQTANVTITSDGKQTAVIIQSGE